MKEKCYDTPPRTRRALEDRLRNLVPDEQLRARARRQLGFTAVAATLTQHARDGSGTPQFAIKGGVALELMLGIEARATKDLDVVARHGEDPAGTVLDALAQGWGGFTFRLKKPFTPVRDTSTLRGELQVFYLGRPWSTVQLEVSIAEGAAGQEISWSSRCLIDPGRLGLEEIKSFPIVTVPYLIAQKLHACTDQSDPERPNDRFRDLIDLLLVHPLVADDERAELRGVCIEIFKLRGKHDWPPNVVVLPGWRRGYPRLAEELGFSPGDPDDAARGVRRLISEIDQAS